MKHTPSDPFAMDLFATEQLNTTRWRLAKLAAFVLFALACCLLGASLVLSQPNSSRDAQSPLTPPAAATH